MTDLGLCSFACPLSLCHWARLSESESFPKDKMVPKIPLHCLGKDISGKPTSIIFLSYMPGHV